jgi:PiT family inorganic phosphate transporter
MAANRSGIQGGTCKKILLAWLLTLPASMLLAGVLFTIGRLFVEK